MISQHDSHMVCIDFGILMVVKETILLYSQRQPQKEITSLPAQASQGALLANSTANAEDSIGGLEIGVFAQVE